MAFNGLKRFIGAHPFLRDFTRPARGLATRASMRYWQLTEGIDPNKVVFSSFRSKTYSDNPKVISEKLHEMYPQAKIVWLFDEPEKKRAIVPDYARLVRSQTRQELRELATARVWVDNSTKKSRLYLNRKRQLYLNTWHGDRAFKKIGYDVKDKQNYRLEQDCHCILAASDFGERMMRSAFAFKGKLLTYGSPRNDCLVNFDPARAAAIRARLGISPETKLLLYAPTYRGSINDVRVQSATVDLRRAMDALSRNTGEKWLCLFRAHYFALKGLDLSEDKDLLVDMTAYEDMADLLLIADALLTDYSSCAMDFCLLGRPIYLFQSDIEQYTSTDREMYFDMKDTPFIAVRDQDALDAIIGTVTPEQARENCRQICEYFGFHETGRATEEACKYIIARMKAGDAKK